MKRVLVVDDLVAKNGLLGRDIIKASKKIKACFDFIETTDKAIELLKSGKEYDLILMDGQFNNCELQGPEAVKAIKEFSNVPVVMISGLSDNNRRGVRKGADDSLLKRELLADLGKADGKIQRALALDKNRKIAKPEALTEEMVKSIIAMLLPLDIDMQTLALLHESGKDTESFLKEMYNGGVDYSQKYERLNKIVIKAEDVSLDNFCRRAEVRLFFSKLSKHADAKSLLHHNWQLKGIKSFHDWYCGLVNILRGGKADE